MLAQKATFFLFLLTINIVIVLPQLQAAKPNRVTEIQLSPKFYSTKPGVVDQFSSGSSVGNGGHFVICDEIFSTKKIYFFDYYYLKYHHRLSPQLNFNGLSEFQILSRLLNNLYYVRPDISKQLQDKINEIKIFKNVLKFMPLKQDPSFFQTQDNFMEKNWLPKVCRIGQMIVQLQHVDPRQRYFFNSDIYQKLDPLNKAIAILHEAIYGLFIDRGLQGDNRPVIKWVEWIINLQDLSADPYARVYDATLPLGIEF